MKTTEPIRDKNHVAKLLMYYFNRGHMRNYLLIALCLHTFRLQSPTSPLSATFAQTGLWAASKPTA